MSRDRSPEFFIQLIKTRRSIRSFKLDPIPEKDLRLLLEASQWAPSAGNLQPWRFIVVRDKEVKERLVKDAYGQRCISQAPVVVLFCGVPEESARYYGERGRKLYVIQDVAAAVQNFCLAAHALGYGTCWVGAFDEEAVRRTLNLPRNWRPMAIVPLGKPATQPRSRRKKLEEITVYI